MATIEQRFQRLAPQLVAEFLGTFGLVFFGCASIIISSDKALDGATGASLVTIALAHGLILAVGVSGAMYISGGQFNPAVSIGLIVAGKQTVVKAGAFVLVQCFAAASAAGMLVLLLGSEIANNPERDTNLGATIGVLTLRGDIVAVFGFEFILTFALMYVILATLVDRRAPQIIGGLCVGAVVAACILAAGPLTGASMNPARSFGPALYGHWNMHWVYWVAPVWGAATAAGVYRLFGAREIER